MTAQQVVSDVFDGREIGRGMFGSHPAFVVSEKAVHQPVHAFDGPMAADDVTELVGLVG
jgi:hypothetical protein